MKKWLMLASLPLLLLVQQEAGANPIYVSTLGGTYPYKMIFEFLGEQTYKYTLTFGSSVDLNSIPPLVSGEPGCTPNCPTVPGSLIIAEITNAFGDLLMPIVNLMYTNPSTPPISITGNVENTAAIQSRSVTAAVGGSGTITGQYQCIGDAAHPCPEFFIKSDLLTIILPNGDPAYQTCIQTQAGIPDGFHCASIEPKVNVPVVNSFMLLGIGLMALGIPLRRGKLA